LIELRDSGQREIDGKQAELADLLKKKAELEAQQKPAKFSMENHPAFTGVKASTAQTPAPEITPTTFKVNDMVMAKWINGDRQFYKAKITMVTGSASAPKFRVKFPDYNDTDEGLSLADIKPLDVSKKRKAEELLVSTPAQVNTSTNNVTTPTANTDLSLAVPARPEPSMVSDGPPKPAKVPRKIANKKVVDSHKANWKNFQAKGAKKHAPKKESMFRTPDLPNARGKLHLPILPVHC
jgi:survival-of-motor-neuron-related-splicing factor 30